MSANNLISNSLYKDLQNIQEVKDNSANGCYRRNLKQQENIKEICAEIQRIIYNKVGKVKGNKELESIQERYIEIPEFIPANYQNGKEIWIYNECYADFKLSVHFNFGSIKFVEAVYKKEFHIIEDAKIINDLNLETKTLGRSIIDNMLLKAAIIKSQNIPITKDVIDEKIITNVEITENNKEEPVMVRILNNIPEIDKKNEPEEVIKNLSLLKGEVEKFVYLVKNEPLTIEIAKEQYEKFTYFKELINSIIKTQKLSSEHSLQIVELISDLKNCKSDIKYFNKLLIEGKYIDAKNIFNKDIKKLEIEFSTLMNIVSNEKDKQKQKDICVLFNGLKENKEYFNCIKHLAYKDAPILMNNGDIVSFPGFWFKLKDNENFDLLNLLFTDGLCHNILGYRYNKQFITLLYALCACAKNETHIKFINLLLNMEKTYVDNGAFFADIKLLGDYYIEQKIHVFDNKKANEYNEKLRDYWNKILPHGSALAIYVLYADFVDIDLLRELSLKTQLEPLLYSLAGGLLSSKEGKFYTCFSLNNHNYNHNKNKDYITIASEKIDDNIMLNLLILKEYKIDFIQIIIQELKKKFKAIDNNRAVELQNNLLINIQKFIDDKHIESAWICLLAYILSMPYVKFSMDQFIVAGGMQTKLNSLKVSETNFIKNAKVLIKRLLKDCDEILKKVKPKSKDAISSEEYIEKLRENIFNNELFAKDLEELNKIKLKINENFNSYSIEDSLAYLLLLEEIDEIFLQKYENLIENEEFVKLIDVIPYIIDSGDSAIISACVNKFYPCSKNYNKEDIRKLFFTFKKYLNFSYSKFLETFPSSLVRRKYEDGSDVKLSINFLYMIKMNKDFLIEIFIEDGADPNLLGYETSGLKVYFLHVLCASYNHIEQQAIVKYLLNKNCIFDNKEAFKTADSIKILQENIYEKKLELSLHEVKAHHALKLENYTSLMAARCKYSLVIYCMFSALDKNILNSLIERSDLNSLLSAFTVLLVRYSAKCIKIESYSTDNHDNENSINLFHGSKSIIVTCENDSKKEIIEFFRVLVNIINVKLLHLSNDDYKALLNSLHTDYIDYKSINIPNFAIHSLLSILLVSYYKDLKLTNNYVNDINPLCEGLVTSKEISKMNENEIHTYKTYIDITKMVAENIEKVSQSDSAVKNHLPRIKFC